MTAAQPTRAQHLVRNLLRFLLMAIVIALVFVVVAGRDGTWRMIGGPADLGAIEFETLSRSTRPNSFLLCPPDFCKSSRPDQISPVFSVPADRLLELFRQIAMADDNVVRYDHTPDQDRFVQRSPRLHFPDTISARFIAVDEITSTLAVYSRSQIGYSDWGVNEKRVYRWLEALTARVTAE